MSIPKGYKFKHHKGHKLSPEHKAIVMRNIAKRINFKKGNDSRRFGKGEKHTLEAKLKMRGENSGSWQGGISFKPYTVDWTDTLRQSIRERDGYRCKICGKPQGDRALDVHHIDYIKEHSYPSNLISLCRFCHIKTNHNRKKWLEYFKNNFPSSLSQ